MKKLTLEIIQTNFMWMQNFPANFHGNDTAWESQTIFCIYEKNPPTYYFLKISVSLKKRISYDLLEYFFLRKSN